MLTIKEEELFTQWKTNENWVKDGVVKEECYQTCDIKVLYILKEANGGKKKEWKDGDLRAFLRDPKRWQTWNNVARWQYAIEHFNEDIKWSKVDNINYAFRKKRIDNSAVINLKKQAGNNSSNMKEIKEHAIKEMELLLNQIALYKPEIIICAGTGSIVRELELLGTIPKWSKSLSGVKYYKTADQIIINYSHPGIRASKKELFQNLLQTLKEIKSLNM